MKDIPSKVDKYEVIEEIGSGGMAVVYKGLHPFLEKYVAIKVLPEYFVQDKEFVDRFTREARIMMSLHHSNIVRIHDAGIYNNQYFIVMDYIEGKTIKELIKEKGKIDIDTALDIIFQICDSLSYAHKNGVIHRDVKPSNIIIDTKTKKAFITDFGIAKAVSGTKLTQTGVSLGTPEYMSPEQFSENTEVDNRTDIYSLGIVFYEMLTGDIPFKGDTPLGIAFKHVNISPEKPRIRNPEISPYLEKIILKMLAKDIGERYKTMDDLIEDLKYHKNKEYEKISALSYIEEKKCRVSITSEPSDAKIYIDGEFVGITNIENLFLSYGKHKIIVTKQKYEDYFEEILIKRKESNYSINIKLNEEITKQESLISETETKKIEKKSEKANLSELKTKEVEISGEVEVSESETRKIGEAVPNLEATVPEEETRKIKYEEKFKQAYKKTTHKILKPYILIPIISVIIILPLSIFLLRSIKHKPIIQPPSPSISSHLSILTIPTGAEIYINGVLLGNAPLENYEVKAGDLKIVLKKTGYEDKEDEVEIKDGEDRTLLYTLEEKSSPPPVITKKNSFVSIYSDPQGGSIYINDKSIDKQTPVENIELTPGTYTIKLTKNGYKDYSEKVTLIEGQNEPIFAKLEIIQQPVIGKVKEGTLSVISTPSGAKVYVNGSYIGITPISKTLKIGSYTIQLKKEGYIDYSTTINVSENHVTPIKVGLSKIPANPKNSTLHIYTNPLGALIYIDGKMVGVSPLYFYQINAGSHEIIVQKDGYMKVIQEIDIPKNSVKTVTIDLSPNP